MLDDVLRILGWIGAAQAALFGAALLLRRRVAPAERWFGSGLLVAAAAAALISLSGRGGAPPALEAAEVAVTLAAGPLLAFWILGLLEVRVGPAWRGIAFLPAVLWVLAAVAGASMTQDARAIRGAVLLLLSFTFGVASVAVARWPRLGARQRRTVGLAIAGVLLLHLAQAARLVATSTTPPHLVSATIGLLLCGVSFAAFRQTQVPVAAGAGGDGAARGALVAAFERLMNEERGFAEPGSTVGQVARRLGTTAAALSQALNQHAGTSFSERLAQLRSVEAERLLADPALDHLSVEAVGARAGFGSRSAFFAEFRKRAGTTPAEYRLRRAEATEGTASPGSTAPRTS